MSFTLLSFDFLEKIDGFFWGYIGFMLVVICGLYFTLKSKFFQFMVLASPRRTIKNLVEYDEKSRGVHPIRLYFASIGGMIGLGNIVGVVSAIILGGPGALFWLWVASIAGMLIKYCEIYLGIKYRTKNVQNGFDGGSIYFLRHAFQNKWPALLVAFFLCIYGVEIFQFTVVSDTLSNTFALNRYLVISGLSGAILYIGVGGIKRLANVCSVIMPFFLLAYVAMCLWIIYQNASHLPELFRVVIKSAFNGHAAIGGFAGSSFILAAQHGISRSVYSGDIGIGYDSIIQAETSNPHPERQARMAVFALTTDSCICSLSMLLVLITKLWHQEAMPPSEYVPAALGLYFSHSHIFIGILLFLAGFTTIVAYFSVGIKSAQYLSPRYGKIIYMAYAIGAFIFFSFFDQAKALLIMSLSGGILMTINLIGILKLRDQVKFV